MNIVTGPQATPGVPDGLLDLPDTNLPDHTQLPDSDGKPVDNQQELPQSFVLTTSLWPVLERRHPDQQFLVGHSMGIFWRPTTPPLLGCKAPDWYYVPNVPPMLDGVYRRSYVMWREYEAPLIVLEFVSGNGAEERDRTPLEGKFWVYEHGIRVPYYGIFEANPGRVEVFRLIDGAYEPLPANAAGRFEIAPLGVELGIWRGVIQNLDLPWLRWWDAEGRLLPHADERAANADQRAADADQRAARLAERLRALGVDPDQL
jgi:Uma2 family endonuclease